MLTADKSKEYCCNWPAKEEEQTSSSNVFICGPSPEEFVAVITLQRFQILSFRLSVICKLNKRDGKFELGKEMERDAFRLVKSDGQRKDSESPRGIQPQIFVSIPPPVRSVFVVTNLQFGKRSLPFSCNLSITATR